MPYQYPTNEPPGLGRHMDLTSIAHEVLKRSNVSDGHRVVIYADNERNKAQIDAFFAAAEVLGAQTLLAVTVPQNIARVPKDLALAAMRTAETVIDLASASWIYTKPFSELLDSGVRVISSMSSPDTWSKLPPSPTLSRASRRSAEILEDTVSMRVWSDAGTDLTLDKSGRSGTWQDGLVAEPGDWDNFPSHQAACAPLETSAQGRVVISPGDLLAQLRHVVGSPITLTLEKGRITSIDGGADAALLKAWFEKWNDPNAYVLSHIGWGLDPRAEIASMQMMEWESFGGNVMIAFGANDGRFLGGVTHSKAHLDVILLNAGYTCDGVEVLSRGQFTHPDMNITLDADPRPRS